MTREVLLACLPWLGALILSVACVYGLMRVNRFRICLGRLRDLHSDLRGGVESVSFVLTMPALVMLMMFIVQVSQVMIAQVVVEYAAYAGARAAVVWIPADMLSPEGPNCISAYSPDPDAEDQQPPIIDPTHPDYGPSAGGMTYLVEPGSPKYERIASASVNACLPISPSRPMQGLELPPEEESTSAVVRAAYHSIVPDADQNLKIPVRLNNKLAYSNENTDVEVRVYHKNKEPPLLRYYLRYDPGQFYCNEFGWQDLVTVTVKHRLALLPGPGRLLSRYEEGPSGRDRVAENISHTGYVYTYPLEASVTMGIEGQIPVIPYVQN
jgi:hypothetical protein